MKNFSGSIFDFFGQYDLFDRFVESVDVSESGIKIVLDMYHCDDPERNEDGKDYILSINFPPGAMRQAEDPIPNSKDILGGTILEYKKTNDAIVMGIEWRLRQDMGHAWTKLIFRLPPAAVFEKVRTSGDL